MFVSLLSAAIGLQVLAGVVPDDAKTWRSKVHRIAAYGEAVLFVPLSILLILSPVVSAIGSAIGILALGYFIVSILLYAFAPKSQEHYLTFQALYIVAFQVQTLVAAYTA